MAMSEDNWKWPATEDICWYPKTEVLEQIANPKLIHQQVSNLVYSVPEITEK